MQTSKHKEPEYVWNGEGWQRVPEKVFEAVVEEES